MPDVVAALREHPTVVVHAPTGAGKTTRLPSALLDAGLAGDQQIWCLQPRRIAARASARHVAKLRGGRPGDEVGWHVRFEAKFSRQTRLLFLTDGMAVRRLQQDLLLEGTGVVIFDEYHERTLPSDLALAMVQRVQRELRDDLKVVVMSATLDATAVAEYLGGAPIVRSQGRSYPVDIRYLDRPDERRLAQRTAAGVERLLNEIDGDILAFLPGVGDIRRTAGALAHRSDVDVLPLHGELSNQAQDAALVVGPRRRVVLATNVAETSLTLDGIVAVVDSGVANILRHDPGSGLDRLTKEPISKASADQRAGRAGRQQAGVALRLWTAPSHRGRPDHDTPALRRTDLAGPILQLRAWGEPDPSTFPWVEPPPAEALESASKLLIQLGLVKGGALTAQGRAAAQLPLHPRLAVLLLEAAAGGQLRLGALAAAVLSERDPFSHAPGMDTAMVPGPCDVLDRCQALRENDPRVRADRRRQILRVAERLTKLARAEVGAHTRGLSPEDVLRHAIFTAWSDRLCLRREADPTRGRLVGGRGVVLSPRCTVRDGDLFVTVQVNDGPSREAIVHLATRVEREWVDERSHTVVRWDATRGQVVARREQRVADLVLDSHTCKLPSEPQVTACLVDAIRAEPSLLPLDDPDLTDLRARLHQVHEMALADVPDPTDEWLLSQLPALVSGHRGLSTLSGAEVASRIWQGLSYEQQRRVDKVAPQRLKVPSGSQVKLAWSWQGPPVLAVRMQEVFGWAETPRVLDGRSPVLLHLLAPNRRPAQITKDLASFWANTWPEVRKELRRRYPKHSWPDDPLTAKAEHRPRRKR